MNLRTILGQCLKIILILLAPICQVTGQGMSVFPWLPAASTHENLAPVFLSSVAADSSLRSALMRAHYDTPVYYAFSSSNSKDYLDGFIMVTRPEQVDEDGKPLKGKSRLLLEPEKGFFSLFRRRQGTYRQWVFVVCSDNFTADSIALKFKSRSRVAELKEKGENLKHLIQSSQVRMDSLQVRLRSKPVSNAVAEDAMRRERDELTLQVTVQTDTLMEIEQEIASLSAGSDERYPSLETAKKWYDNGSNSLNINYLTGPGKRLRCTAMLYEYKDTEGIKSTRYVKSLVIARDQLEASKIFLLPLN